jgi:hypothetical protein
MLDKLAAASSSSACMQVVAALHLQVYTHLAILSLAQQNRSHEKGTMFIAEAPGLLQQVQRIFALVADTSAAGDSSSSSSSAAGSSSSAAGSSSSAGSAATVFAAVVPLQLNLLLLLDELWFADSADAGVLEALNASDSLAEAAMQLLCAYTYSVYDYTSITAAAGTQQRQQQRQQQRLAGDFMQGMQPRGDSSADAALSGSSSSSSSSSSTSNIRSCSTCSTSFRRPVQASLLPISPVHERLQLLPVACRQLYLQEVQMAAPNESMGSLLPYVQATLKVLSRHVFHALTVLDEQQQQQQQQQKEHALAANSTPAAAGAAPAAAAAAAGNEQELSPSCVFSSCPVLTEQAVLLVIEFMQLLAGMSEQADHRLQYESLRAYRCGALLLHRQLEVLQRCPALHERYSSVVQQSAQQLMQLLRWQLQLAAQRNTPPSGADASLWQEVVDSISTPAKHTLFVGLGDAYPGTCLVNVIQPKRWPPTPEAMCVCCVEQCYRGPWTALNFNLAFHAFEPCHCRAEQLQLCWLRSTERDRAGFVDATSLQSPYSMHS